MGQNYGLVRLKVPLAGRKVSIGELDESKTLPFGPPEDITRRLLQHGAFHAIPEKEELARTEALEQSRPKGGLPAMKHPVVNLRYSSVRGDQDVRLLGDPVTAISVERSVPWDLLPVVDALGHLAPFCIVEGSVPHLLDPEDYRPGAPEEAGPVFGEPVVLGPGPGGSPLAPLWQVETSCCLQNPLLPLPEPGVVLVTLSGLVTALEADGGRTLWTRSFQGRWLHAAAAGRVVVVCGGHPAAFGLSGSDGSVLWERRLGGEASAPAVPLPGGKVAMAFHAGGVAVQVLVLRAEDGEVVWEGRLEGAPEKGRWKPTAPLVCLHAAGSSLLVSVGELLYSCDTGTGAVLARHAFEPFQRGALWIASVRELASVGSRALVLFWWAVKTMSLPRLESTKDLVSIGDFSGIERFACSLGPRFLALGTPRARDRAVLTVLEADSLQTRYEIEVEASPSPPADLGGRWACLLRPLRERRDQEAVLLVVETESGKVLHREPLGSRGWYMGHVAASGGRLFTTCKLGGSSERAWGVRAFEVATG